MSIVAVDEMTREEFIVNWEPDLFVDDFVKDLNCGCAGCEFQKWKSKRAVNGATDGK